MASGVAVGDECVKCWNEIKLDHKFTWCTFVIKDKSIITVERTEKGGTYDSFVKALPTDEGRYCIYDFPYKTKDGRNGNKLCFIVWAPDTAPIKSKMLYASSKDALKKKLQGIGVEIQATDFDEISQQALQDKINSKASA
eukprot:TRINITY_DN35685_c0_g1_i1.p1 TRINITY_DN35685_c0_g1~~TRINITY_DN35685_c0_g1_i1.p1  ORF type:complete len:152 (+),score=32.13 TRINITY_DN35685_c0_g1_i1:37-456(+)